THYREMARPSRRAVRLGNRPRSADSTQGAARQQARDVDSGCDGPRIAGRSPSGRAVPILWRGRTMVRWHLECLHWPDASMKWWQRWVLPTRRVLVLLSAIAVLASCTSPAPRTAGDA